MILGFSGFPDLPQDVEKSHVLDAGEHVGDAFALDIADLDVAEAFAGFVEVQDDKVFALLDGLIDGNAAGQIGEEIAESDFTVMQRFFRLLSGDGDSDRSADAFEEPDQLGGEFVFLGIVQLEQADHVFSRAKRNQGDGFIALFGASTPDAGPVGIELGGGQQSGCAVGPEASAGSEEGTVRIGLALEHHPAETIQDRIVLLVEEARVVFGSGAEEFFRLDELLGESVGQIIGEIVAVLEAQAHRFHAEGILDFQEDVPNQIEFGSGVIEDFEDFRGEFLVGLGLFLFGDVRSDPAHADGVSLFIPDESDPAVDEPLGAVGGEVDHLPLPGAGFKSGIHNKFLRRPALGIIAVDGNGLTEQFFFGSLQALAFGLIDIGDDAVEIGRGDSISNLIQEHGVKPQNMVRLETEDGLPEQHGGVFEDLDSVERDLIFARIGQMNQSDDAVVGTDGNDRDGFVAVLIADVAGLALLLLGDGGKERGGPVHVKGPAGSIKGEVGIGRTLHYINADAMVGMDIEGAFLFIEVGGETGIGLVGDVSAVVEEPDADAAALGIILDNRNRPVQERWQIVCILGDSEQVIMETGLFRGFPHGGDIVKKAMGPKKVSVWIPFPQPVENRMDNLSGPPLQSIFRAADFSGGLEAGEVFFKRRAKIGGEKIPKPAPDDVLARIPQVRQPGRVDIQNTAIRGQRLVGQGGRLQE